MILVTGGAGFIGSNLVKVLNERGLTNIIIVDNLKNAVKHLNLNKLKFIDYIDKNDFIQKYNLKKLGKFDKIYHIGACSDTTEYDGRYMMSNNYEYSKNIFLQAKNEKIQFIYASSASVYGNGDNGFVEKIDCEYPLNVYAYSKFLFDQFIRRELQKNPKLPVVALRFFNVYGPQENHKAKMASVIFHFFNQIKQGNNIKLFEGSQKFRRDFIYVKDIINIIIHFSENSGINGIYNAGTGNARSFEDIADIILKKYPSVKKEYIPFPETLKGKYQSYTQADLNLLHTKGKFTKSFMTLEEGVVQYLEILKNNNGYLE